MIITDTHTHLYSEAFDADRNEMIQSEDIAEVVSSILKMSSNALIEEVRISPRDFNPN